MASTPVTQQVHKTSVHERNVLTAVILPHAQTLNTVNPAGNASNSVQSTTSS